MLLQGCGGTSVAQSLNMSFVECILFGVLCERRTLASLDGPGGVSSRGEGVKQQLKRYICVPHRETFEKV